MRVTPFTSAKVAGSYRAAPDQVGINALDHAGQDFARATLHHVGDASGLEGLHAFDPAHRAKSLAVQGIGNGRPFVHHGHVNVVDHVEFEGRPR